ncbi:MAG: hypothetical protein ACK4TK_11030 [Thiobacillaceae bacterium]
MRLLLLLLLAWLALVAGALLWHRRGLMALWREPVLDQPVLIIESDDWGAGPVDSQTQALNRLVDLLTRFRDRAGRHPVMTLALVLAVPDGPAIRREGDYRRLTLADPLFAPLRAAIERGRRAGVFALQLHGMEHYWPPALMASRDPSVRAWLESDSPPATERLPAHLQSRWTDASVLPSRPLSDEAIEAAVREEVALFERLFGEKPRVAVPPTFVWDERVEAAWAGAGIEVVVTPGLRSRCRNAKGLPDCDSGLIVNGQTGPGVRYIVRNDYFEPERGHRAAQGLDALQRKWAQRRPCLLETHRSNFIGEAATAEQALAALGDLIEQALRRYPNLRFMDTATLASAYRSANPVATDLATHWQAWRARVRERRGFMRCAKLAGLGWLFNPRPALAGGPAVHPA